ncbi:MAG: MFS transporter [Pseudomonadota bacterium]
MLSLSFFRANGRLIAFGVFMCFCSSMGQTFFISLFGGEIRAAFGISHGTFGSLYAVGTLASAATIIWFGRLVDRWPLGVYGALVLAGLAVMCFLMSQVWSLVALTLTIYGLRLFGQGLAVHTAITAMARYFEAERGRAVSIASLGNTLGEALLPPLVVLAFVVMDWRFVWALGGIGLVVLLPTIFILLKGQKERDSALKAQRQQSGAAARDRNLKQALKDPVLWLLLPALFAPSFIFTGLIFHQVYLAESKGWPLSLLAGSYSIMAAASVLSLILSGWLVDRVTARRLVPWFLLPLGLACVALAFQDGFWVAPVFMALFGLNTGLAAVITGAIWAELYGVSHLGAIRAFGQAVMVFSSGLAPAILGLLIDVGINLDDLAGLMFFYCVLVSLLAAFGVYRRSRTLVS